MQGAQVIDLEALAGHRGSVFGLIGAEQPAQKGFESALAAQVTALDPARPVFHRGRERPHRAHHPATRARDRDERGGNRPC